MSLNVKNLEQDPHGPVLLVDGDLLLYTVGFTVDHAVYKINNKTFRYKKEAIEYCAHHSKFLSKLKVEDIEEDREIESFENSIYLLQRLLASIGEKCDSNQYLICFSGEDNFRKKLNTDPPYKGNREDVKPYHYYDMKSWIMKNYYSVIIHELEADDIMGCLQKEDTIICSFDKDMKMIPGHHYNWKTDKREWISRDEAAKWFWIQMLVGDAADNIKGIHGIGEKKAVKLLDSYYTVHGWESIVKNEYEKVYGQEKGSVLFNQNAMLLWIKRHLCNSTYLDLFE